MTPSRSITRTLMTVILLTSGTVLLLAIGTFLAHEFITYRRSMVQNATTLARVSAANSTGALAFDNLNDARSVLTALAAERHIQAAALYDRRGVLFARYPEALEAGQFPLSPGQNGARFTSTDLEVFEPVLRDGRALGTIYLRFDLGAMRDRFVLYGGISLGIILLTSSVAVIQSSRLQRQISRPVLELAATARVVAENRDFSVRATRYSDDELGQLTDAFNAMLAHVQEQDASLREQGDRLRHEVQERSRAEAEVRALNAGLERRVEERTEALAAANRELESFSYSVSHDLRAPLRHVGGFVDLLEKELGDQVSDRGRRFMHTIRKASLEMGQLIDDLLTFSRTSRTEMKTVDVPLDTLVAQVIQTVEAAAPGRTIAWDVAPLPAVVGDYALLKQVLVNLLDNAVKYTRRRETACIAVGCEAPRDGFVTVFVRDNGAGFDMQYAKKLFGVFQRMHRSEEFEGTGIGLATVQRIVARHGGRVWADSAVDRGTTFFVTLPVAASS